MIVYGARITSDIAFPLNLPHETAERYKLDLSSIVPAKIKNSITCGMPFYHAHGRNVYLYSDRVSDSLRSGQPCCYEVEDVVRFYWLGGERTIFYQLGDKGDAHLLSFWFIHLFLPFYFTIGNLYDFFHAGAVEIEGRPVLFIAPSMGGKSTLTNFFIRQGHALVSDDKVPTYIKNNKLMTVASHPYHRPYRKFEELGYLVKNIITDCKPIRVVFAIKATGGNGMATVDEIMGYEKINTIMSGYLFMFPHLTAKRLHDISKVIRSVRVLNVKMPWGLDRQAEVYKAICTHIRAMQ